MGGVGLPSRMAAPHRLPWGGQDGPSGGSGASQSTASSAPGGQGEGRGRGWGLSTSQDPAQARWGPQDARLPRTRAPRHRTL